MPIAGFDPTVPTRMAIDSQLGHRNVQHSERTYISCVDHLIILMVGACFAVVLGMLLLLFFLVLIFVVVVLLEVLSGGGGGSC